METFASLQIAPGFLAMGGVPFFIRAKSISSYATEMFVTLKRPPQDVFGEAAGAAQLCSIPLGPDRVAVAIGAVPKSQEKRCSGARRNSSWSHQRGDEMKPMNG